MCSPRGVLASRVQGLAGLDRRAAQANVDAALPAAEWPLDALAAKMQQYCPMLTDLSADQLAAEGRGDFEALRTYLRRRGAEAYQQKVRISLCWVCSIQPLRMSEQRMLVSQGRHRQCKCRKAPPAKLSWVGRCSCAHRCWPWVTAKWACSQFMPPDAFGAAGVNASAAGRSAPRRAAQKRAGGRRGCRTRAARRARGGRAAEGARARGAQVREVEALEEGLMAEAQRFIVLGQTGRRARRSAVSLPPAAAPASPVPVHVGARPCEAAEPF